ncbi:MAG: transcription termination/antitermination protein NusA [Oceanicaulis sp.]|jgi:N utilization substance protein A|uniref:transcription termination factor NusA n=1 Tax=unclassified Oceanicaulis TaxID=2632123 RepID=UPI0000669822|nr:MULTISPECIES: transcription termination factor NusA [unclassified Oceanicaulis]EAP89642.1 transcription elongation factor NusA [Oceanicaulis sp. HTCC2633]MAB68110.1 transcription termination/antitermination protein NusA [Oceanicaulis sp.]MBC38685.1 transcription termination/antitermination protein NusA [Oceanicaulis sp.]MBG36358.1 transcription termination/antitermination protein NusA [Oceanicaulis sp.]HBU62400.1 transcription termination/antitermination protein NusA [Oceanicaulis sp.]|tara:strand:+ start:2436 stop:4172 length:1737 start_codon:yes stop_codon:yes gene_type:complete
MAIGVSANKLEILQIARAVAQEKMIDESIVLEAIEEAIQKAARSRYGAELDIHCKINPKTGEMRLTSRTTVVEEVENEAHQITLDEAKKRDPEAEIGSFYEEELPPIEFGRVASQTAKQVITQKVREAERKRQFNEYKDRIGEIVNGIVKRVEYGNVIIDLGKAEGIIRRSDGIPRESLQVNDRVRAYIYDVREETRGPQIFLSRAHPDFMAALFAQEVPEVYEGVIEIPRVARDPGSRAKIAVISNDSSIDPVGACVGMRGSRVQAVVNELAGEKIDIIPWNPDPATFIVNALQPAEVAKVVLDDEAERIEVVVPDDQLSLAIGRRGQNVRLASQLTGWAIDILTEEEESERRQKEFSERTSTFMNALDVDEVIAQLLATEGFAEVEDIAFVELDEIAVIEGFDDDTAQEIQTRAREFLEKRAAEQDARRKELGVEDAVLDVEGVDLPMAVKFGENEVCTIEDLAGLTPDDLRGWYETRDGERVREPGILEGSDMSPEDAEMLIMRARVIAGWISEEDLPQAEVEVEEVEDETLDEEASDVDLEDIDLSDLEAEAEKLGVDLADLLDADATEEDEQS